MLFSIEKDELFRIYQEVKNLSSPKRDFKLTIEEYEKSFNKNKPGDFLQYLTSSKYREFAKSLLNNYKNDKKYINLTINSFLLESHDEQVYLLYLKFLEILKVDYPQFILGINYLQNEVIKFYTHFNDNSLTTLLNEKTSHEDLKNFEEYFSLSKMKKTYYDEHQNETVILEKIKNMQPILKNDIEFIGDYFVLVLKICYTIIRIYQYKWADNSIVEDVIEFLGNVKNQFITFEETEYNTTYLDRIQSIVSAYYNIKIKYTLEVGDKKEVNKIVEEYLNDVIHINKYSKHFKFQNTTKTMLNLIEIINFNNVLHKNNDRVFEIHNRYMYKIFNNFLFFEKSYYKRMSNTLIKEFGMFLSASSLMQENNSNEDFRFKEAFVEFYHTYKLHENNNNLRKSNGSPIIPLDFIWE